MSDFAPPPGAGYPTLDFTSRRVAVDQGAEVFVLRVAPASRPRGGCPVILYEPGAFGIYADGYWIAVELARLGYETVLYSRLGAYPSDPLPQDVTPSPLTHAMWMEQLLDALEVPAVSGLIAHSMGGLRAHALAARAPNRVRSVLLLDAVMPVQLEWGVRRSFAQLGIVMTNPCRSAARTWMGRMALSAYPNSIGLPGQPRADKKAALLDERHLSTFGVEMAGVTAPALSDLLPPITHCPLSGVEATPVAKGTAQTLKRAADAGQWTHYERWRGVGHVRLLNPKFAPRVAALADKTARAAGVEAPEIA